MKRTKRFISIVVACLTLAAPVYSPLLLTGCGTPAAKTTQVAGTVTTTVDAAMKSWGAYVRAGKATVHDRIKVRDAYLKYQAAMATAESVALTVVSAPEGQATYQTALSAASAASANVIALIETFTRSK